MFERNPFEHHLVRFGLRQIEHVVDHAQQRVRRNAFADHRPHTFRSTQRTGHDYDQFRVRRLPHRHCDSVSDPRRLAHRS
ncbi:hypothetical protein WM34_31435 [Burkholderia ubonensis]|uniref:Uncharacterized protein n=1 Tax=Burkholderia ubonensis TaxID=101571 RepID=A0AAU8UHG5_9BURK|nr:hypothetical protein WK67_21565 [Burkholderia ubonensis]KVU00954.1 hypothetical protein WK60_34555 [Burkholderia ubonensis]KWD08348.1 hypothetical protein WL59_05840 [Burkholderia ubonensis]KWD24399.1 hypothetical protein WL60_32115 [Burkholderia ubonensis]KWO99525.1 hypothetical protein WM34_31435 [Burkholderia ubonensis]